MTLTCTKPRRRRLVAFGLVAALGLSVARAEEQVTGAGDVVVDARAWLSRIHDAASQRNYQGTQVFSASGAVSSSRVTHYCEGAHQYERLEMLDGQARRVLRHNEVVYTLWTQKHVAVIEQRDPLPPFPALLQSSDNRLTDHYELRAQNADRVAGHEAQVLLLRPRDGLRFAQRLWAEKSTGLLLRADVLGPRDEVLESSAFSEVTIGMRAQPETVLQPMKRLDGYKVLRPVLHHTQLETEGWSLKQAVPGFRQVSCVKRPLDAVEPDRGAPQADVLQAIFSDGLTHVSVFIEPFDAQRHQRAMNTAIGATHTLMKRQGDWWVTVVGDVPTATLKLFAGALERRR